MPRIKPRGRIHDTATGYDFTQDAPLSPITSIRKKCLECRGVNFAEVRRYGTVVCTLRPYSLGNRPEKSHTPHQSASFSENSGAARGRAAKAEGVQ